MNTGWQYDSFRQVTGFDLRREWQNEIDALVTRGWACVEDKRFGLTRQGLRFADAAAAMFLK